MPSGTFGLLYILDVWGKDMSILIVKVEDEATLAMNEFFDYGGMCYGMSRGREAKGNLCLELEDFYQCTVKSREIAGVPVFFLYQNQVVGWYKKAVIYRYIRRPALFLEGNIAAHAADACLLPVKERMPAQGMTDAEAFYKVIDKEDAHFEYYQQILDTYCGQNEMVRYPFVDIHLPGNSGALGYEGYIEACQQLAQAILGDRCQGLKQVKTLEVYADRAIRANGRLADGYYYSAMAQWQMGFVKKGLKQIEKALQIEPDAGDLYAMKGNLLISLGRFVEAANMYQEAFDISGDETYLILEGRSYFMMGHVDAAANCYSRVKDVALLKTYGIDLKDAEHKWRFIWRRH